MRLQHLLEDFVLLEGQLEGRRLRSAALRLREIKVQEKIYWLLEYCKRYGTLPFAGLARAGFIAVARAQLGEQFQHIGEGVGKDKFRVLPALNRVPYEAKQGQHVGVQPVRLQQLSEAGFTAQEQACLVEALRELTNSIIREDGFWRKDAEKIGQTQKIHHEREGTQVPIPVIIPLIGPHAVGNDLLV